MHKHTAQQGFTLMELSIVIGLIAAITASILVGKSMEKAAKINQAVAMYAQFLSAWQSFKTTYNGIPGDLANATEFWGVDTETCPLLSGVATSAGTCNGNGDGKINWYSYAQGGTTVPALPDSPAESSLVFQQLMLAGLLKIPVNREVSTQDFPYYIYPKFRMQARASWYVGSHYPGRADLYPADTTYQGSDMTGNGLQTGVNLDDMMPLAAVTDPATSMSIDQKMDDGMPTSGKFRASKAIPYATGATYDAADLLDCYTDYGSGTEYNLSITYDACRLILQLDP